MSESSWNYRLIRHNDGCVTINQVWYDEHGTVEEIDTNFASIAVDPEWADEGTTVMDLVREELAKFTAALSLPMLVLPSDTEEEV